MSKFDRVLLQIFVSKPYYLALYSFALLFGTVVPLIRRWFYLRMPFVEGLWDYALDLFPIAFSTYVMLFAARHLFIARQRQHEPR